MISQREKRIFTLTFYNFCVSTPILNIWMTIMLIIKYGSELETKPPNGPFFECNRKTWRPPLNFSSQHVEYYIINNYFHFLCHFEVHIHLCAPLTTWASKGLGHNFQILGDMEYFCSRDLLHNTTPFQIHKLFASQSMHRPGACLHIGRVLAGGPFAKPAIMWLVLTSQHLATLKCNVK